MVREEDDPEDLSQAPASWLYLYHVTVPYPYPDPVSGGQCYTLRHRLFPGSLIPPQPRRFFWDTAFSLLFFSADTFIHSLFPSLSCFHSPFSSAPPPLTVLPVPPDICPHTPPQQVVGFRCIKIHEFRVSTIFGVFRFPAVCCQTCCCNSGFMLK